MSGYDSVTTREKTHVVLLARHREQQLDPKEFERHFGMLLSDSEGFDAGSSPRLYAMDALELLGIGRRIWPRLVAVLVIGAFVFAPHFSAGLTERIAEARTRQITSLLDHALRSVVHHPGRHRSRR